MSAISVSAHAANSVEVSIVVPTYREADNLCPLLERIAGAMASAGINYEVLIVDDNSQDGSEAIVGECAAAGHPAQILVRRTERGLSSAVIHGFRVASGRYLVCMDADLSHPPETIPEMIRQLSAGAAELVIGSRYVAGGTTAGDWGVLRWLNSKVATLLARPFVRCADPMSGFFALARSTFERADLLNPIGYKICLELAVKCGCRRIVEVPIHFANRLHGQSKLSLREQTRYLQHLKRLADYRFGLLSRFVQFCVVGGSGMAVDLAAYALAAAAGVRLAVARAVAIWLAMTWNYVLNRRLTFRGTRPESIASQYLKFVAASSLGAVISWSVSMVLTIGVDFFAAHIFLAAVIGILIGTGSNFLMAASLVFPRGTTVADNLPVAPRALGTVVLLTVAVRLVFFAWGLSGWHTLSQSELSQVYFQRGYGIAAGYGYVDAPELRQLKQRIEAGELIATADLAQREPLADPHPDFLHPPGMALLVAVAHRAVQGPADLFVEGVAIALDVVAACLITLLAGVTVGGRLAKAAGIAYALYPPFAYQATFALSPDNMLAPFVLACTFCLWWAVRRSNGLGALWSIAAGLFLGMGSYLRPDYLLLPVALGMALCWPARSWRTAAWAATLCQSVALAVLLPWAYRNHEWTGRWIFTSTSVGATLITGLAEYKNPWGFGNSDEDRHAMAQAQGIRSAWDPAADVYFRDLFRQSVRERPAAWLTTTVKRMPLAVAAPVTWGLANPAKTERFGEAAKRGEDRYDVASRRPLYLVAAYWDYLLVAAVNVAALVGFLVMFWRQSPRGDLAVLGVPYLYSAGTHLLTHFEPRFLLPSLGCLLVGLAWLAVHGCPPRWAEAVHVRIVPSM